jgi:hypothetical protein
VGGGHRKANPRVGKKSPLRGDRRREQVAGRKRIASTPRRKETSPIPISDDPIPEVFTEQERKILYTLVKRKVVGEGRPQELGWLLDVQRITSEERDEFVATFKRKAESGEWLTFYTGEDDLEYVYINVDAWNVIRSYLEISEP